MPFSASGAARSTSSRYHELPPSISVSPGDKSGANFSIVEATYAAGTINQIWRGDSSAAMTASGLSAAIAPSDCSALTASGLMS